MSKECRISAKNLGKLALDSFCPRCFWIQLHTGFSKLPYQVFPGIFSSLDSYNKKIVKSWFDQNAELPKWLSGFSEVVEWINPPHFSKFKYYDPETDILLTGEADGIFRKSDGSYIIADFKTAKLTPN